MGPASWRVQRAIFEGIGLFEPGNAECCSPVQYCSPRLEPRPQLSSTFGLSPDHRNFRKNFRESLINPKLQGARLLAPRGPVERQVRVAADPLGADELAVWAPAVATALWAPAFTSGRG